jgi:hypothetical protein
LPGLYDLINLFKVFPLLLLLPYITYGKVMGDILLYSTVLVISIIESISFILNSNSAGKIIVNGSSRRALIHPKSQGKDLCRAPLAAKVPNLGSFCPIAHICINGNI